MNASKKVNLSNHQALLFESQQKQILTSNAVPNTKHVFSSTPLDSLNKAGSNGNINDSNGTKARTEDFTNGTINRSDALTKASLFKSRTLLNDTKRVSASQLCKKLVKISPKDIHCQVNLKSENSL